MPELPEVEIMTRKLLGWTERTRIIQGVNVLDSRGRYLPEQIPMHQKLESIYRMGKVIVFSMSDGLMICHHAMSGYWDVSDQPWTFDYVEGRRKPTDAHIRVILTLTNNAGDEFRTLRFHDSRKFGSLLFYRTKIHHEVPSLKRIGPDALTIERDQFRDNVMKGARKRRMVKEVLMDQSAIAGVGNIYASEALWLANVRPDCLVRDIDDRKLQELLDAIKSVLNQALERNLDYKGLRIYRRKFCPTCTETVQKLNIKGRSSYFCGKCQL